MSGGVHSGAPNGRISARPARPKASAGPRAVRGVETPIAAAGERFGWVKGPLDCACGVRAGGRGQSDPANLDGVQVNVDGRRNRRG